MASVIVIVADDVGVDKVPGFLSPAERAAARFLPITPTLDQLGEAGLRFTHTWANPVCSPTRASVLTGQFAFHHGVGDTVGNGETPELDPADVTLADELAAAGFATGAWGKWHLGTSSTGKISTWHSGGYCPADVNTVPYGQNPQRHGFGYALLNILSSTDSYVEWPKGWSPDATATEICIETGWHDEVILADALAWITGNYDASTGTMAPYFAWIGLKTAHLDGDGGGEAYDEDDLRPSCGVATACLTDGARDSCGDSDGDGADDEQWLLYRALVSCMDAEIGTFLDDVARIGPGALDDTVIVFLGDNGTPDFVMEAPFTSGLTYGKGTPTESGVRVPLVVAEGASYTSVRLGAGARPGLVTKPGRTVVRDVLVQDLYPTLLDAVGVAPTGAPDGESFAPCFADSTRTCGYAPSRPVYTEQFLYSGGALASGVLAYKRGAWKLAGSFDAAGMCLEPTLFDVRADPYEAADLYATTDPAVVQGLQRDVGALGASWLPTDARGAVSWCR